MPGDGPVNAVELMPSGETGATALTSKGQAALETAERYAGRAHAHATKRAYRSDWVHFGA